jgi:hypothetical protein
MSSIDSKTELLEKLKNEEVLKELEAKLAEVLSNSKFGELLKSYDAMDELQISIINQSSGLNFPLYMGCCWVSSIPGMKCPCPR